MNPLEMQEKIRKAINSVTDEEISEIQKNLGLLNEHGELDKNMSPEMYGKYTQAYRDLCDKKLMESL